MKNNELKYAEPLRNTRLPDIEFLRRGKVRDIYDAGEHLLMVSTDRISCFDVVLQEGIPSKGEVLNRLSVFWFQFFSGVVQHHFITADIHEYPQSLLKYSSMLQNRSMLVRKARPIPIECVVRAYLAGSAWKEYQQTGVVCGIVLPKGLKESERLPELIFTPATKEESGHDMNVSESYVENEIGKDVSRRIKDMSLILFKKASDYAASRGIIIADTKFEFGICNGEVILIDEVLTPDSSRFWLKESYRLGSSQPSFDKQFVRDYLDHAQWNKEPPAPALSKEVIRQTEQRYRHMLMLLTAQQPVPLDCAIDHMTERYKA
jgi:phosphoribosylaminoimidazole-succinocarboxamide synthase